ncbi:hypothetical protein R6Q59_035554 [Mikania micrantha]
MVLSNKKLKQKLRSVLAESLATSESQANQPNRNDSQTHHSFKSLLNSVTQKPKLSKREVRRVKIPSLKPTPDHEIGVQGEESEVVDGGLKKNKKRKREKDVTEGNDLSKKKKKKKKKIKKKKAVKKEEKGVQTATGGNEEQNVTEEIQIKTHTSKEDESIGTKIYVGGIPYYSTVDDIQSFFEACGSITEIDCLTFPETGKFNGIAMISFRTEAAAKRALALDGSDMGGLSLKIQPFKATRDKKVSDFAPAMLEGYNRIYAGNLSWDMTEDELKKFFSDCKISSIRLGKDKETGEFKGFAHVDFADSLSLTMALKLDQKPLFGRPGERAGEGVKLEGERPQALAVEGECAGRLEALGEATYDGVPVNGDWRCDVVEYSVRETAGGGAKFDQPGSSQAMEIETDGDEMMWRWPTLVVEKTGEADDGYVVGEKMGVGRVWVYIRVSSWHGPWAMAHSRS